MPVKKVCVYPDSVLRRPTEKVEKIDEELKTLIEDLWETMYALDGLGLAAPQIGVSRKVAVVDYGGRKFVLINPEITEREGSVIREEGCLSFPGIYEKLPSPEQIRIKYLDENGKEHDEHVTGFLTCVFCHETDHLNGRMIIDRISPLKRSFLKKKIAKKAAEKRRR